MIEGRKNPDFVAARENQNAVPEQIVEGIKAIARLSGDLAMAQRNQSDYNLATIGGGTKMSWCPDGSEAVYNAFVAEIDRIADNSAKADFVVRAPEMVVRIATIVAVGKFQDSVRRADIEFGIEMVRRSMKHMISGADEYMTENDQEANRLRVGKAIIFLIHAINFPPEHVGRKG